MLTVVDSAECCKDPRPHAWSFWGLALTSLSGREAMNTVKDETRQLSQMLKAASSLPAR